MIHKRYYSPFENNTIVQPQRVEEPICIEPQPKSTVKRTIKCSQLPSHNQHGSPLGFLANIKLDDIILIALLILLLCEDNDKKDMPLIIGVGVLLLIEFFDND